MRLRQTRDALLFKLPPCRPVAVLLLMLLFGAFWPFASLRAVPDALVPQIHQPEKGHSNFGSQLHPGSRDQRLDSSSSATQPSEWRVGVRPPRGGNRP